MRNLIDNWPDLIAKGLVVLGIALTIGVYLLSPEPPEISHETEQLQQTTNQLLYNIMYEW